MKKFITSASGKAMLAVTALFMGSSVYGAVPAEVDAAITSIGGDLEALVALIIPAAVGVLAVAIGIWMIPRIVGALKRAFSAGGGR